MTLDEIKARCDEVGECWEWRTDAKTDRAKRHPMVKGGKLVRRIAYEAAKDFFPEGHSLAPKCGNPYCINPDHQRLLTFTKQSALGGKYSPTRAASVARTRRERGLNKVTPEVAREIRDSNETGVALARRLGVYEKTIWNVRRGFVLKDFSDPFAGMFSALLASNDDSQRRTA